MKYSKVLVIWMSVVFCIVLQASASHSAASDSGKGYSIEDFKLHTASDLVDVCTLQASHADYTLAIAFCYGFFEGATHYDDAIAASPAHPDLVCSPPEATRTQAVTVFVEYMNANPQYGSEQPIDAIFRALVNQWPCIE
ncbi:MAG: Rap1a/Tai family immunity protein [Halioglobus sp.]